MERIENSQWKLSLAGFTAFFLATIFYLITGLNTVGILSFLTSAIVLFIINAVYVLYTKKKLENTKNQQINH